MASIAQMTGSLIDSGCKHIIPVRTSFDFFTRYCQVPQENMLRNKMKYSMHKGDLVLCVGTNMFIDGASTYANNDAYPPVATTFTPFDNDYDKFLFEYIADVYDRKGGSFIRTYPTSFDPHEIALHRPEEQKQREEAVKMVKMMPDFRFMGFSLGLAYAHPNTGDTVASSLIGGLMTVRNGPWQICTGDKIQWCFFFENDRFDDQGKRTGASHHPPVSNVFDETSDKRDPKRLKSVLQQNGVFDFDQYKKKMKNNNQARSMGKIPLAVIKPFFDAQSPYNEYPLDRCRVFAKALNNARPWDNVDIMICTQH